MRDHARATRDYNLINLTDSYTNHTPWERCITRGVPGGIFPPGYGAGYRILQTPGYVVILYEMIHEARIIPIDGPPPIPGTIRQWNGDSRGRWEGNTLVVEVGNYNSRGAIATNIATRGARGLPRTEDLRVVERFTVVDADTIEYEVTISDPAIYTGTWKVAMPLNRDETYDLFEYACHEGNYGLPNSLSAGPGGGSRGREGGRAVAAPDTGQERGTRRGRSCRAPQAPGSPPRPSVSPSSRRRPMPAGRRSRAPRPSRPLRQRAEDAVAAERLLRRYCIACHNSRLRTADLALDDFDPSNVGTDPENLGDGGAAAAGRIDAAPRPAAAGRADLPDCGGLAGIRTGPRVDSQPQSGTGRRGAAA